MAKGRSSALLAFLIGGVAGAAIALLYAPASGRETRKKIRDGVDDAGDWTKDRFEDARESLDTGAEKIKGMMGERKEDLRAAFEAGKDAFQKRRDRFLKKKEA